MNAALPPMLSPSDFAKKIDELTKNGTDYIDAIVDYCSKNGIEIETAAAMIKAVPSLKSKLQVEAEDLNILQRTARLPID